jgi:hypothetical protein
MKFPPAAHTGCPLSCFSKELVMKKNVYLNLLTALLLALPFLSQAQESTPNTLFNLLSEYDPLKMNLVLDLDSLQEIKRTNNYMPSKFSYQMPNKEWEEWDMEIRARGKFRRTRCDFPPIKLNFSEKELKKAGFKPYDEFKLVSHCLTGRPGKVIVLREYLIYKLYNILTPYSLRVKLVNASYMDSNSKKKIKNIAILIEPKKELEKRLNAETCDDCFSVMKDSLNQETANIQALFQYMIGNTDWDIEKLRNVDLVKINGLEEYYPIPYDFDFSGLVEAPYAVPSPDFSIRNNRQRLFLGMEEEKAALEAAIQVFEDKKEELYEEVKNFKEMSGYSRKRVIRYLDKFYNNLTVEKILATRAYIVNR